RDNQSVAMELLLAVLGSVVGTVLARAAGIGPWGTLAGAAILAVVSTTFSPRKFGENGRVRAAAITVLTLVALTVTWSGVSLADHAAGRSVLPGPGQRQNTFPGEPVKQSRGP